jgi:hypothetical protein
MAGSAKVAKHVMKQYAYIMASMSICQHRPKATVRHNFPRSQRLQILFQFHICTFPFVLRKAMTSPTRVQIFPFDDGRR